MRARFLLALLAVLALARAPAAAPSAAFGHAPDGSLLPGCSYVSDAPAMTARIEFVGGIEFAEGEGPSRPKDPAAEVASLQVGELTLAGVDETFAFAGAAEAADGFLLRWQRPGPPVETVTVYTRWASLRSPSLRKKNVMCRETAPG